MTNDERVYFTLSDSGVPMARLTWGPASCLPPTPYGVYEDRPSSVFADDGNYASVPKYRATLYQGEVDQGVMSRFESAVSRLGTYVRHSTEYEDGLFVTRYDFTLLGRSES